MPFTNTVQIDHDYGSIDALRYLTPGGSPISGAQVRIYRKSDYDARNLGTPVAFTMTKADGRWQDAALVEPGFTYTIRFELPNYYGPDTREVIA